jgi:hypothetical protein
MDESPTIVEFWNWFAANADRYFHLENDMQNLFAELAKRMKAVDEHLTFAFSPVRDDGKREFVISAGGIRDSFPTVLEMVRLAPELPQWVYTAFRPPSPFNCTIEIEGLQLSTEDIFFHEIAEGEKLGLVLYTRGYRRENRYDTAIFILLDNVLGEYDVEMKIGSLEFASLPDDYQMKGLKPLLELEKTVAAYFAAK